jgi:hypothetical protein
MVKFREKFSTFFFGLTVGLLIGCAIFIFKLDDYVKNFQFASKDKPTFEETINAIEDPIPKKDKNKKQPTTQIAPNHIKETNEDTLNSEKLASNDSVILDYTSDINLNNENVLREELISSKSIKIKEEKENYTSNKDSLIATNAGITESLANEFMIIEFWKTPLNSKGYKMSRNKILLYGVAEQNIDVLKIDNNYYLKNNNLVYRVFYSNEFKKMERVNESAILARIN